MVSVTAPAHNAAPAAMVEIFGVKAKVDLILDLVAVRMALWHC